MYQLSFLSSLVLITTASTICATPHHQPRQIDPFPNTSASTATSSHVSHQTPTSLCTSLQHGDSNIFWYWIDIYPSSSTTSSPSTDGTNNTSTATTSTTNTPSRTNPGQNLYHKLRPCNVTNWVPVTALGTDGAYSVKFYTGGLQDECVEDAVREAEGQVVVCEGKVD